MTSDTETGNKLAEKSVFTEREEALLKIAWNCLKTAPEIDYEKFQVAGGFNTMKTTQNTWGKIKKKLVTAPDGVESPGGPRQPAAPKPKKKTVPATPRKRRKNATDGDGADDDDDFKAVKRSRRTPVKKEKTEDEEDETPVKSEMDKEFEEEEGDVV